MPFSIPDIGKTVFIFRFIAYITLSLKLEIVSRYCFCFLIVEIISSHWHFTLLTRIDVIGCSNLVSVDYGITTCVYTILNQHTSFVLVVPVSNSPLKDG